MFLGLLACCAFIAAVYVTGVHDASNSVAVPVRTRALGERSALYLAALFNVLGVIGAFLRRLRTNANARLALEALMSRFVYQ